LPPLPVRCGEKSPTENLRIGPIKRVGTCLLPLRYLSRLVRGWGGGLGRGGLFTCARQVHGDGPGQEQQTVLQSPRYLRSVLFALACICALSSPAQPSTTQCPPVTPPPDS